MGPRRRQGQGSGAAPEDDPPPPPPPPPPSTAAALEQMDADAAEEEEEEEEQTEAEDQFQQLVTAVQQHEAAYRALQREEERQHGRRRGGLAALLCDWPLLAVLAAMLAVFVALHTPRLEGDPEWLRSSGHLLQLAHGMVRGRSFSYGGLGLERALHFGSLPPLPRANATRFDSGNAAAAAAGLRQYLEQASPDFARLTFDPSHTPAGLLARCRFSQAKAVLQPVNATHCALHPRFHELQHMFWTGGLTHRQDSSANLMVQSQPWVHRVPSSQLAPWREILQDEAIRAVELSVLVDGMATPLHRLSPKLYRVADDVPDWLLQAAGRSHRFGNRQLPLSSKYLWLRLSARTSATPAQNGTTAVNLTVCSDLSTKLSHDCIRTPVADGTVASFSADQLAHGASVKGHFNASIVGCIRSWRWDLARGMLRPAWDPECQPGLKEAELQNVVVQVLAESYATSPSQLAAKNKVTKVLEVDDVLEYIVDELKDLGCFSRSRFLIEGKSRTMIKLAKLITEEYVPLPAWASVTNFNLRYALTEAIFHWLGMSPRF